MRAGILWGAIVWTVISGWAGAGQTKAATSTNAAGPANPKAAKALSEKDAVQVMEGMRKALESNRRSRLIGMFDAGRMPQFPVFRDQLEQFFAQYESFQVRYRINQIALDGEFGSVVCEFSLEALPVSEGLPGLRKRAQMRLVLAWDGSAWKIADLSPRSIFQ